MELFLNEAELSLNSGNLINHWSVNWVQFKDFVSHMCLAGGVVASWSLTQDVANSSLYCNDKYVLSFRKNSQYFVINPLYCCQHRTLLGSHSAVKLSNSANPWKSWILPVVRWLLEIILLWMVQTRNGNGQKKSLLVLNSRVGWYFLDLIHLKFREVWILSYKRFFKWKAIKLPPVGFDPAMSGPWRDYI